MVPGYYLEEDGYNDGMEYWYYADGDGNLYANTIESINGKKYAFNEYGRMIDGLVFLEMDGSSDILSVIDAEDTYDTPEAFDEFASVHLQLVNSRRMNLEYIVQYCGVTS